MSVDIRPIPRMGWDPLPYDGCIGVVGRVLVREEDFSLRSSASRSTPIVVCLEGEGFTSVAGETAPFHEGEQVRWPKGIAHRLWTEDSTMTTLMVERANPSEVRPRSAGTCSSVRRPENADANSELE